MVFIAHPLGLMCLALIAEVVATSCLLGLTSINALNILDSYDTFFFPFSPLSQIGIDILRNSKKSSIPAN